MSKNEMTVEVTNCPNMATFITFLFNRLHTTYGAAWKRQFEGIPESDVKSNWGYELAWTFGRPDVIRYALDNLPEKPMNAIEFRNLCRKAPAAKPDAESEDIRQPAHPSVIKKVLTGLAPAAAVGRLDWARALKAKDEFNPQGVTQTIRKMYRDALGLNRTMPAGEAAATQGAQA